MDTFFPLNLCESSDQEFRNRTIKANFNQQMRTLLRATNEYPCKVKTKCSLSHL